MEDKYSDTTLASSPPSPRNSAEGTNSSPDDHNVQGQNPNGQSRRDQLAPGAVLTKESDTPLSQQREDETNGQIEPHSDEPKLETSNQDHKYEKQYEVSWDGDQDPMNPKRMSKARKWLIVLILSACSSCVTCASSLYTSTYAQIEDEFQISRIVATLGLSIFVVGLGLSPMMLGPLSEFYGRR